MGACVIVPVHNRRDFIGKCLDSLLRQTVDDYEIVVIDDGSTDGTKEVLQGIRDPRVKVIYNETNRGPAASRNRGIKNSNAEYIAFIDSDAVADKDWLGELMKPFENDQRIMMTAGKINDPPAKNYWELVNKGGDFVAKKGGYVKKAIGCNMAGRKEFLIKNGFDETMRYAAAEEADLCLKCLKEGYKIFYNPRAQVVHHRRSDFKSTLAQQFRYGFENARVNIKNRHFPYINYGSWLLIAALMTLPFPWLALSFLLLYLVLVLYVSMVSGAKTFSEVVLGYPGFLLRSLADCLGNISYLIYRSKP